MGAKCSCQAYYDADVVPIEDSVTTGAMDYLMYKDNEDEVNFLEKFEKIDQPEYDDLITKLCDLIDPGDVLNLSKFRESNKKAMAIFIEKTMIRINTRDELRRLDVYSCFLTEGRGDKEKVQELIDLLSPLLLAQPEFDAVISKLCALIDREGDPLDFGQFKDIYPTAANVFLNMSKLDPNGDHLTQDAIRAAYLDDRGYGDVDRTKETIQKMKAAIAFDEEFKKLCKLIDPNSKGSNLDTKVFQKYATSVALLETQMKVDKLPDDLARETLRKPFINDDESGDMQKLKAFIDDLNQSIEDDKRDLADELRRQEVARQKELEKKFNVEFTELISMIPSEGDILHIKKFRMKQEKAAEALLAKTHKLPEPMCSVGELKAQFGLKPDSILTEKDVENIRKVKKEIAALIDKD